RICWFISFLHLKAQFSIQIKFPQYNILSKPKFLDCLHFKGPQKMASTREIYMRAELPQLQNFVPESRLINFTTSDQMPDE
ncbi:hypothetical protein LINPERHAP2_LOCUS15877, partial [Linum perenne]